MKIIGTGLSGLVGSRIVELLQNIHEFVDLSLDSGVDITDFDQLKSVFDKHQDAEVVLHLAAFTDVNAAFKQKDDKSGLCYRVNVLGTENLAKLCREADKYLIHISTDFVFDGKNPPTGGYTEKDIPFPIEWYGQTKLWSEKKVQQLSQNYIILRLAFPFKAKPSPKKLEPRVKLDLVRKIKDNLEKRKTLSMFTDQIITPTFIDDVAEIIKYVFKNKPQGIYHLVGSRSLSPFDLAQRIAQTFNLDRRLIKPLLLKEFTKIDLRPRQAKMILSNKKLVRDFGIKMHTVEEALQLMKEQLY